MSFRRRQFRVFSVAVALGAVVLLGLFSASMASASGLKLGTLSRTISGGWDVYEIPVRVQADGYSTMQVSLLGDADFVAGIEARVLDGADGAVIRFDAPAHLGEQELTVRIEYQDRRTAATYRLSASAQAETAAVPMKCHGQWFIRGTLLANLDRILRICGRALGDWPMARHDRYVDYVIEKPMKLPAPGGLDELLAVVRERFGLDGRYVQDVLHAPVDFRFVDNP